MKKFEEMGFLSQFMAIILTKLQELLARMVFITSSSSLNKRLVRLFDYITDKHFELFYGSGGMDVLKKFHLLSDSAQKQLLLSVLVPFYKRQSAIILRQSLKYNHQSNLYPTKKLNEVCYISAIHSLINDLKKYQHDSSDPVEECRFTADGRVVSGQQATIERLLGEQIPPISPYKL